MLCTHCTVYPSDITVLAEFSLHFPRDPSEFHGVFVSHGFGTFCLLYKFSSALVINVKQKLKMLCNHRSAHDLHMNSINVPFSTSKLTCESQCKCLQCLHFCAIIYMWELQQYMHHRLNNYSTLNSAHMV